MAPPRLPLVRGAPGRLLLLLAVLLAQLGPLSCENLRGSVTCLDCAAGHHLSGVVVAVKCVGADGAGLHAAQTDGSGNFDVAVPAASGSRCAARVLGGAEQLCAPRGLAVARVVTAAGGSYALGSRLAVFTRCGGGGAVATMATGGGDQRPAPPGPTVRSPPRGVGRGSRQQLPTLRPGNPSHLLLPFHPHHRHPLKSERTYRRPLVP